MRMLIVGVALVVLGCANDVPAEPGACVAPIVAEPFTVCARPLTGAETEFAERLWGVRFSCREPDVTVVVREMEEHVGFMAIDGTLTLDPRAWNPDQHVDLILAHELGHALGHDHEDGDRCSIMASDGWDVTCIRDSL